MRIIGYIILIFLFCSCEQKEKILKQQTKKTTPSRCVDIDLWSKEVLNIDSVLLNGDIKIINSKTKILEYFGTPIDIITSKSSGFLSNILKKKKNSESYIMVYKNIIFEGVDNTVILKKIILGKNHLETPNIIFKKDLNIRNVCMYYPESCKLTIPGGNAWSGHIELLVYRQDYFRWFLTFKSEKLVSIELHRFF